MKECSKCGQTVEDSDKFCPRCGGSQFIADEERQAPNQNQTQQSYQAPHQNYQQTQQNYQAPRQSYQAPQQNFQEELVSFGEFFKLCLIFLIPIYGFIKMIMVAMGGPKYSTFMTNMTRYSLAMCVAYLIFMVALLIFMAILGLSFASLLR